MVDEVVVEEVYFLAKEIMMKQLSVRSGLLCCAICLVASTAAAKTYSEKTFLTPRSPGVNLPVESIAWQQQVYAKPHEKMSTNFQYVSFYEQSSNRKDIAKYFGVGNNSDTFVVGPQLIGTADVFGDYLIHDHASVESRDEVPHEHSLNGTVKLRPKYDAFGVFLDYHQDLGDQGKGAYFKILLPIVHVHSGVHTRITNETESLGHSLADFFQGHISETSADDLQSPLKYAKIDGPRSSTGFSDMDVQLGYRFYQNDEAFFFANLGAVMPSSNKSNGEHLFEPLRGNGGHFGFGAGFDGGVQCWSNHDSSLRFLASANYRYLFSGTDYRTMSLNIGNFSELGATHLGQYLLIGEYGQEDQPLFPAANVLTQGLKVTPGSCLDADLAFGLTSGKVIFDLGYNFFWKDKEEVKMKESWNNDAYAIAVADYDTADTLDGARRVNDRNIAITDINVDAAATPSYITNKMFTGLGYAFELDHKYPCFVGLGGSYEFAYRNNAVENWNIWTSTGITF